MISIKYLKLCFILLMLTIHPANAFEFKKMAGLIPLKRIYTVATNYLSPLKKFPATTFHTTLSCLEDSCDSLKNNKITAILIGLGIFSIIGVGCYIYNKLAQTQTMSNPLSSLDLNAEHYSYPYIENDTTAKEITKKILKRLHELKKEPVKNLNEIDNINVALSTLRTIRVKQLIAHNE